MPRGIRPTVYESSYVEPITKDDEFYKIKQKKRDYVSLRGIEIYDKVCPI